MISIWPSSVHSDEIEGRFVIGRIGETPSLHPYAHAKPQFETYLFHKPLTYFDSVEKKWECGLCEKPPKLSSRKLSNGRKEYFTSFKLKKSLRWNDGSAVTTQDVLHSWNVLKVFMLMHKKNDSPIYQIRSIKDLDQYKEFEITYAGRPSDYLFLDHFFLLPSKVDKPAWDLFGSSFTNYLKKSPVSQKDPKIGTFLDPVKKVNHVADQIHITWKKGRQNLFTDVQTLLTYYSNLSMLRWSFRNKIVHFIPEKTFKPENLRKFFDELSQKKIDYFNFQFGTPRQITLMFNLRLAKWKSLDLRKFICSLGQASAKSISENDVSIWRPSSKLFLDDSNTSSTLSFNTSAFQMKKAGFTRQDNEAPWMHRNFSKIQFSMSPYVSKIEEVDKKFFEYLEISGVSHLFSPPLLSNPSSLGNFKDGIFTSLQLDARSIPTALFNSKRVPSQTNLLNGNQNVMGWNNKKVDAIISKLSQNFNTANRKQEYLDLEALVQEEVPLCNIIDIYDFAFARFPLLTNNHHYKTYPSSFSIKEWTLAR